MAAMRVAIAGSNSLAVLIAYCIQQQTNYQFVVLSRFVRDLFRSFNCLTNEKQERPALTARNFPVLVVDYNDTSTLQHALMGVDAVISTVTGNPQIALIHAAAMNRVSRFAPAEFTSVPNPSSQPQNDPLDRGRSLAAQLLHHYRAQQGMEFCMFVCGAFYERFSPGGLQQHGVGLNMGAAGEGDYVVNIRTMAAEAPIWDADGDLVKLCLTSMHDVARFVVEALGMREWPVVLTMQGDRMTVQELVTLVQEVRSKQARDLERTEPFMLMQGTRHAHAVIHQPRHGVARIRVRARGVAERCSQTDACAQSHCNGARTV